MPDSPEFGRFHYAVCILANLITLQTLHHRYPRRITTGTKHADLLTYRSASGLENVVGVVETINALTIF